MKKITIDMKKITRGQAAELILTFGWFVWMIAGLMFVYSVFLLSYSIVTYPETFSPEYSQTMAYFMLGMLLVVMQFISVFILIKSGAFIARLKRKLEVILNGTKTEDPLR